MSMQRFSYVVPGLRALIVLACLTGLVGCGGGGGGGGTGPGASSSGSGGSGSSTGGSSGSSGNPFNNPATASVLLVNQGAIKGPVAQSPSSHAPEPVSQFNLSVGSRGSRTAVSFTDTRNSATTGRDIFAQQMAEDGSLIFGQTGTAVSTATGDQDLPATCVANNGDQVVVYDDHQYDARAHISLQRLDAGGNRLLGNGGVLVSLTQAELTGGNILEETQAGVQARSDNSALVWWLEKGSNPGIGAACIDAAGTIIWKVVVADSANNASFQGQLIGVNDSSDGLILVWTMSNQTSNGFDVWAQRLNSAGVALWNGGQPRLALGGVNRQYEPTATADGSGGVFIAARDDKNYTAADDPSGQQHSDITSQRVLADGTLAVSGGVAISTADLIQNAPTISAIPGFVLVAWDTMPSGFNPTHAVHYELLTSSGFSASPRSLNPLDEFFPKPRSPSGDGNLLASAKDFPFPQVEADGTSGFHFLWGDNDGGGQTVDYNYVTKAGGLSHTSNLNFSLGVANRRTPRGTTLGTGFLGTAWEQFPTGSANHTVFGRPLSNQ